MTINTKTSIQTMRTSKILLLLLILTCSLPGGAREGATVVVKERMDYMKSIGNAAKDMGDIFKGRQPFDIEIIRRHTVLIAKESPRLTEFFPEGSLLEPSEAKPEIWSKWERFKELADGMTRESRELEKIALSGDQAAIRSQFSRLARACKNCHKEFREKKK